MTVFAYVRVSTERQADEGVSLEEQIRRVEGRAHEQGWQIAEVFIERGVSGSVPLGDRPEGTRLVAALQPGDVVIAAKLDRVFRSAWDALNVIRDLQRRQISLWLLDLGGDVSGDGIAKLVLTILAAIAEFERERIGERIRDAKRHQRRTGQYLGGDRPFGWRIGEDGALIEDETEQSALAEMRVLRSAGSSYRSIAAYMKNIRGIEISHQGVKRALGRLASLRPEHVHARAARADRGDAEDGAGDTSGNRDPGRRRARG